MKKVVHRNSTSRILGIGLALMLMFSTSLFAQDGDPAKGKQLFNANCAACHNLDRKMTGPALRGVGDKYEKQWLYDWIHNSAAMVKAGDPQAVAVFEEYNGSPMTAFPQLSEEDIDNIIAYAMEPKPEPAQPAAGAVADAGAAGGSSGFSNNVILAALVLVFGVLVVMLYLVNKTLKRIAEANGIEFEKAEKRLPIWKAFVKNQFLVLVSSIALLLIGAYFAYGYMMQVGVDQGYMPVQPIHFSHKIHAGDNKIDCKYCHSSARVSKTSGIPSLNVCMNCHKNIMEYTGEEDLANGYTKDFYTGEIQKLYKAVGWDANNQQYTGESEPVKWVRIHNLPDFVYFNHSQHVSVAGVECQKCHGPVEEMEVMYQHAPLTMGWCIECHRETDVKMDGNEYYEKIHEELSKKYGVEKLTAAQMGALECGKCHY
ncbi:Class III cytochrome C family protein [Zhouia amylolytica]|uniref:Class III cytochrome C family protein n=1 Tax=Zhouia amylolytica TaxID=376730 RepID=A0A1I6VDD5_9FLAO|nr:c-type cytochrome [Zhouia amylolytica]MCQ0110373.1 c-type cytochrome [Zhouia amylolytica]SFT11758.1 Class III cytochrome C family protein [Zhouia amylolytica]